MRHTRRYDFDDETQALLFIENLDLANLLPLLETRFNEDNSVEVNGRLVDISAVEQIYRMEHA